MSNPNPQQNAAFVAQQKKPYGKPVERLDSRKIGGLSLEKTVAIYLLAMPVEMRIPWLREAAREKMEREKTQDQNKIISGSSSKARRSRSKTDELNGKPT
jgi:hypothetical protein